MNERDTMRVKTTQMLDYNKQTQVQHTKTIDILQIFYWLFALYVVNGVFCTWTKYLIVVLCTHFVYIYEWGISGSGTQFSRFVTPTKRRIQQQQNIKHLSLRHTNTDTNTIIELRAGEQRAIEEEIERVSKREREKAI